MRKHLQYLRYILRHKWFVLLAGLKIKAPLWRLLVHDLSKLRPSEWGPYVDYFYGTELDPIKQGDIVAGLRRDAAFDVAWLHHQHRNLHHWQYWLLREDSGSVKQIPMPERYIREMVADWAGAGRAINGYWELKGWYEKNRDTIQLHPDTRKRVDALVGEFFNAQ